MPVEASTSESKLGSENLWNEILAGARRHGEKLPSKHVLVLGEAGHGKSTLIENIFGTSASSLHSFNSSAQNNSNHNKSYTSFQRTSKDQARSGSLFLPRKGPPKNKARDEQLTAGASDKENESTGLSALDEEVLFDARLRPTEGLAVDFDWVDWSDGDIDNVPPLSFYSASAYNPTVLKALPSALPSGSLPHTGIMIVLDWTRPHTIAIELARWLAWIDEWSSSIATRAEEIEGHDKLASHLQHYSEPQAGPSSSTEIGVDGMETTKIVANNTYTSNTDAILPLPPGSLTHNKCGVPIMLVLTKADKLDSIGDKLVSRGMVKGKGLTSSLAKGQQNVYAGWNWDERVDWALASVRVAAMMYGASVFYTTIAQPKTFALLKKHVLHRLYTSPPALHPQPSSPTSTNMNIAQPTGKFPFPYRANQLDRDSIMIPAGWDTWGKIEALKEGFQCKQINEMWDAALEKERAKRGHRDGMKVDEGLVQDDDDPTIDQVWKDIIPDLHSDSSGNRGADKKVKSLNEQDFLSKQLESLLKDPHRDPRRALRHAALVPQTPTGGRMQNMLEERLGLGRATPGVVGPMASDGLSMPNVEMAFAAMEGKGGLEDIRTPSISRRETKQNVLLNGGKGISPASELPPSASSNDETLNNFFQGLIAGRRTPGSTPSKPESGH